MTNFHEHPQTPPLLLSRAETAELLGISEKTLYTLTKEQKLPHVRLRGRVMYRHASLDRWLAENELGGAA